MPIVRVPTAFGELEDAVASIEEKYEVITAISAGDGAAIVWVKPKAARKAPVKETR